MELDKQIFLKWFTIILTLMVGGILAMMFFHQVDAGIKDIFNMMTGSIVTAWTGCVSYWFGTSSGSSKKDAVISSIAKGSTDTQA